MLSIIVCSRKATPDKSFEKNINSTIGCAYELIIIDNSTNNHSIFSAYNLGAGQSKFDYICFVHEDIQFETSNWGKKVVEILVIPHTGVLGVAGAKLKTKAPSPWWVANGYENDANLCYNIVQKRKNSWVHELSPSSPQALCEVAVLDGIFLCCKRDVWEQVKFDEQTFAGFHFYDLDFCLKAKALGYRNFVTYEILIKHSSVGNAASSWLQAAEIFHQKWRHHLPVSVKTVNPKEMADLEYQAQFSYLWLLIKHQHGSLLYKLKIWIHLTIQKLPVKNNWRQLYSMFKQS